MSLTLEDGSGIAGANSFIDTTYADGFHAVRGNAAWVGTLTAKEAALAKAFDYLCNEKRYRYRGTRTTAIQRAPFPRTGCSERGGPTLGPTDIPWRVKDAQAILALIALAGDLEVTLDRGGAVASESVGPISTSYFAGANPERVHTGADGLLEPLLWGTADWRDATPYATDPAAEVEFERDTYNNLGMI